MEVKIPKSELNKALYLTQSIVERKTTMPILSNLLISASEGKLRIAATDLEITASTTVPANVEKGGSTTVSARVLADIVRELPDYEVSLKLLDGERLELKAGNSQLKMVGVSAEEYPSLPGMSNEVEGSIEGRQLLEMLNKTLYAVSHDETRFNLNGVCFEMVEEEGVQALRLVATDGHRLAMITRPVSNLQFNGKVIVPRKGLAELKKVLDVDEGTQVKVGILDGFFVVEGADTRISMRLIDGEFPDYGQVLPKDEGVDASVNGSELAHAVKRVALMVTDKGKCTKLDFSKDSLRVSSSSPELGEAKEDLPITYAGETLSLGFNAKYLIDVANSLEEEETLVIELHGELGPGKFSLEGDKSYIAIVMPMRLT